MKKFLALIVAAAMILAAFPVLADGEISVVVDGVKIQPTDVNGESVEPFAINGTTYLTADAVADALSLQIDWDGGTNTVFIGGVVDAEAGDGIQIYLNGSLFTPTDEQGDKVEVQNLGGSVFLPVRAIATAFGKDVAWDQATQTVTHDTRSRDGSRQSRRQILHRYQRRHRQASGHR